jgi:hypothetical protein
LLFEYPWFSGSVRNADFGAAAAHGDHHDDHAHIPYENAVSFQRISEGGCCGLRSLRTSEQKYVVC